VRVVVGRVVVVRVVVGRVVVCRVVVSRVVVSRVVVSSSVDVRLVVVCRVVVGRVRVVDSSSSRVDEPVLVAVVDGPGSAGAGTDMPAKKPSVPSKRRRKPASRDGRGLIRPPLLSGAPTQT
jgi:hypothetical protein